MSPTLTVFIRSQVKFITSFAKLKIYPLSLSIIKTANEIIMSVQMSLGEVVTPLGGNELGKHGGN